MPNVLPLFASLLLAVTAVATAKETPMPAFRDPITDGAADPNMVWNRQEKCWWMLYTQRRANADAPGVSYCYGTRIGVASTPDDGKTWVYRGTLDLDFEPGTNTFWAPTVVYDNGTYHLFVTYIPGVRTQWGGVARFQHYTGPDLWTWKRHGDVTLPNAKNPIDATLMKTADTWRMWFKENNNSSCAESEDLTHWRAVEGSRVTDRHHEGPIAFRFGGHNWLIVDAWQGMAVYKAKEPTGRPPQTWAFTNMILGSPSKRAEDGPSGAHGDVIVDEAARRCWVVYFTHPGRPKHTQNDVRPDGVVPYDHRRSSILIAELRDEDGKLVERRDGVEVTLPRPDGP